MLAASSEGDAPKPIPLRDRFLRPRVRGSAIGEIVRDLVLGRHFVDIKPLSVERFARSAPRPEHSVI
jgi:hypothetical protein